MKLIRIISTQEKDLLQIRFWPTDICNFNCSYCFPGSHDNKFRYPKNTELVVKNFRKLFNYYASNLNKKKFHLTISGGGEPTLWPELEKFCREIKQNHDVYITLVSNASRTLRWWNDNCNFFDDVVLSYHHEFSDIDHHIAVADLLFSQDLKVTSLVLMDATNWDTCSLAVEQMKTSQFPWYIQTKEIVDAPGKGVEDYNPKQVEYVNNSIKRIPDSEWLLKRINDIKMYPSLVLFKDGTAESAKPQTIILNQWNKFNGWKCNLGQESIVVNAEGKLLGSCTAEIFDRDLNLFSPLFDLSDCSLNKRILCPFESCVCQPDTHISKEF
jgi:wyosine [tRNA(Phe)-imidazoG37] synthetase (radical SAM superfamily)